MCQPKKKPVKTPVKTPVKKTVKKTPKKTPKKTKTPMVMSAKKGKPPAPTADQKACSKTDDPYKCGKNTVGCAWDPKKNPKCYPEKPTLLGTSLTFSDKRTGLEFTYPITAEGLGKGYFVIWTTASGKSGLYLKYSDELLATMKSKYALELKKWWCVYGSTAAQKFMQQGHGEDESMRIGKRKELSEAMLSELGEYMDVAAPEPEPEPEEEEEEEVPVPAAAEEEEEEEEEEVPVPPPAPRPRRGPAPAPGFYRQRAEKSVRSHSPPARYIQIQ